MDYKKSALALNNSPIKRFKIAFFEPASAWIAILILVIFTVLGILMGAGKILNWALPVAALGVGVFLYFCYPIFYVGFTWWVWFLIALVRRLADYTSGYTEPSPMLLAPFLVTGVTLLDLWKYLPRTKRYGGIPFVLSFVAIIYGFCIGFVNEVPLFTLAKALLGWLIPVSFGFHLFINWRQFPKYRQNVQRVFIWGILVMGVYGIIQFVALPNWDRLWLMESEMFTSAGSPDQSGGMRVWSTMHSNEPFAAFMAGGLLLLLDSPSILTISASTFGYLSFFLSTVRSAWGGWLAGLLGLYVRLKPNLQIRVLILILITATCVLPLTTIDQFSDKIYPRFESFYNLEEDTSLNERQELYNQLLGTALTSFIGRGLGKGVGDSAFLSMFFQIGWLGTIFYMGGMFLLIWKLFQSSPSSSDSFIHIARAIVITSLVRIPFNGILGGASGMILWGFIGLGLASQKYDYFYSKNKTNNQRYSL